MVFYITQYSRVISNQSPPDNGVPGRQRSWKQASTKQSGIEQRRRAAGSRLLMSQLTLIFPITPLILVTKQQSKSRPNVFLSESKYILEQFMTGPCLHSSEVTLLHW